MLINPVEQPVVTEEGHEALGAAPETELSVAPQWKLVWLRFKRHRLAVVALVVLLLIYLGAAFCEFVAPSTPAVYNASYPLAPPQQLRFFGHGSLMFVYGYKATVNTASLQHNYTTDYSRPIPVGFFVRGAPYRLWGLIPSDIHLIGPIHKGDPFYLAGTDTQGRDMLTLTLYGSRISMSIGLVGVSMSLLLGIVLGGLSGYLGGWVDNIVQRTIEFLRSIPTLPLWLGLAAAVPPGWGQLKMYFAITVILSLIGWTDLARVVRGRFLQVRNEDFVLAAELDGSGVVRTSFRHVLPSFTSHIIASLTLAIPAMILGETALSFLGLGLQAPTVSWGVLLQQSQNVNAIANAPWLLVPGAAVVIAILSLNFVGDGLRDSADPYAS